MLSVVLIEIVLLIFFFYFSIGNNLQWIPIKIVVKVGICYQINGYIFLIYELIEMMQWIVYFGLDMIVLSFTGLNKWFFFIVYFLVHFMYKYPSDKSESDCKLLIFR